jgi:hypothetical protein
MVCYFNEKLGEKTYPAKNTTTDSKMRKLKLGIAFVLMFVMAGVDIFAVSVGGDSG